MIRPATESEKTILGAILLDNTVLRLIADRLCPGDFSFELHQILFKKMIDIFNKHKVVDVPMLVDRLKITDEDEAYIYRLANECPSTANVKAHADIIREKSVQRQLVGVSKNSRSLLERLSEDEREEFEKDYVPQKEILASFLEATAEKIRCTDIDNVYLISILVEINKAFSRSVQVMKYE
jgi:replicative DNA helicase